MRQAYITQSKDIVWKPSPVVALATSVDDSQVAAARDDGSLEVWLVSPGAVGWHCLLTIQGDPISRVSSLVWCRVSSDDPPCGRLFSSSIDGTVSEWDLFHLKPKIVLDTIGVSIWQMALAPMINPVNMEQKQGTISNGHSNDKDADECETSDSEGDSDSDELYSQSFVENSRVALGCDDGCVRIYSILDSDELVYTKSFPRVGGRILSVTWSPDAKMVYSGSSDGYIRCWDAKTGHEIYRITVGLGGLGDKNEVCVWSLIALRSGTLVSGDSTGSVQFWDGQHGTQLQAHTFHKGDVNALAAAPSHNRVFSAGSDGKVVLYKLSTCKNDSGDATSSTTMKKWVYIGHVQAHTHDVRALTVAVPISQEDVFPDENVKRIRSKEKHIDFSYHKWAHLGIPMLTSAGDDTKMFAYSINEFTKFSPHDICPAPQRGPIQLVLNSVFNQMSLLLVQASDAISILSVSLKNGMAPDICTGRFDSNATTVLAAKVSCKAGRKIVCSAISPSGSHFTYSDHLKPHLYELKWDVKSLKRDGKAKWVLQKKQLLHEIPFAHSMVFSFDSSRLMIAGHDRRIYVVDARSSELVYKFTPCREGPDKNLPPTEPPITKMITSSDGQWLAAINCFGDIYVFNLEIQRQHWFISRLNGASVTAGGFPPQNSNVLIITTSSNQVYAFDVEAKQLGDWSIKHTHVLPRRFQEFPGEVIGLSFPATSDSTVVIYSARAMCLIDFGMPVDRDDDNECRNGGDSALRKKLLSVNGTSTLKRKLREASLDTKLIGRKNFEFYAFRNPVLFIGHMSRNCVLILDKPWSNVLKTLEAPPVHRHIYGT